MKFSKNLVVIILWLGMTLGAYAQSSISLNAPSPSGVPQVTAQLVGNRGNRTFYYWVVARYLRGQGSGIIPSQISIAPNAMDGSNYVRVLWNPAPGALSYDVLRTTTSSLPSPCVCSIATGQTGFTFNNQTDTLSSYTYSPVPPATGTWSLNNSSFLLPRFLMNRQMDMYLGPYTVATLPTPNPEQPWRFQVITDGASSTDCTVGGGASAVVCMDNGGAWVAAGTGGSGSGTVTSVSFTGGLISVANPTTTPALTVAGTSGGIPYFSAASTWASTAALTANLPVIGGGAGVAPSVGTRSGNTTAFVTTTGAQTSGRCVTIDASGNHVADSAACGVGVGTVTTTGTMTANAIVTSNGTTVIKNPSATATLDTSGNFSTPGAVAVGVGGSTAGAVDFTQGTTQSTGTTAITLQAPTSVTSYLWTLPGTVGTTGLTKWTVSGSVATQSTVSSIRGISFTIGDPAGSALTAGATTTDYIRVPFACTIVNYSLMIDAGTITVKFWKVATGTAIPTSGNSINTSGVAISSGTAIQSSTVSDFTTTAVAANDLMAMNVTATATAKFVNGVIGCQQ